MHRAERVDTFNTIIYRCVRTSSTQNTLTIIQFPENNN